MPALCVAPCSSLLGSRMSLFFRFPNRPLLFAMREIAGTRPSFKNRCPTLELATSPRQFIPGTLSCCSLVRGSLRAMWVACRPLLIGIFLVVLAGFVASSDFGSERVPLVLPQGRQQVWWRSNSNNVLPELTSAIGCVLRVDGVLSQQKPAMAAARRASVRDVKHVDALHVVLLSI